MNNIAFLRGYLQKESSKSKAGKTVLKSFEDLPNIVDDVVDVIKGKQVAQTAAAADDPLKALIGKPVDIAHPSGEQVQGILRGVGQKPGTFEVFYPGTGNTAPAVPAREILGEAVDPHWLRPQPIAPATPGSTSLRLPAEATEAAAATAAPERMSKITLKGPPPGATPPPRQQVQLSGGTPPPGGTPPGGGTPPPPAAPAAGGADDAAEAVTEAATEAGSPAGKAVLSLLGSGALGGALGYGAGMATSPTQTDLNNEVRKMELAESRKLLNMLKSHRAEQQMERPGAGKSLYI
jgi:hypothetical protein